MSAVYKVVVLGYEHVGKTSISLKFVNNEFSEKKIQTTNACYLQKSVKLSNGKVVKLAIWDTAGQEQFNSVARIYYRDAVAAIVAYDITKKQTFVKVRKWVEELEQHADNSKMVMTIAGNKCDLENQRAVNHSDAEQFAKENNAKHFLVSAKNGMNVNELFNELAERAYERNKEVEASGSKKRSVPRALSQGRQPEKKKNCC